MSLPFKMVEVALLEWQTFIKEAEVARGQAEPTEEIMGLAITLFSGGGMTVSQSEGSQASDLAARHGHQDQGDGEEDLLGLGVTPSVEGDPAAGEPAVVDPARIYASRYPWDTENDYWFGGMDLS